MKPLICFGKQNFGLISEKKSPEEYILTSYVNNGNLKWSLLCKSLFSVAFLVRSYCGMQLLYIIYYFWNKTFYGIVNGTGSAAFTCHFFIHQYWIFFFSQRKS